MRKHQKSTGFALVLSLIAAAGCKRTSEGEDARKAIEEAKDDLAEVRTDLQEKQEALPDGPGPVGDDRTSFIDKTQQELADLYRDIAALRSDLQLKSMELDGQTQREIAQSLAELDDVRAQARSAFERFKLSTSATVGGARREAAAAIERTRSAYQAARASDRPTADRNGKSSTDTSPGPDDVAPDPPRGLDQKLDQRIDAVDQDRHGKPDRVEVK